ncbi:hypothetical protein D3C76_1709740 [compost metagenome]
MCLSGDLFMQLQPEDNRCSHISVKPRVIRKAEASTMAWRPASVSIDCLEAKPCKEFAEIG